MTRNQKCIFQKNVDRNDGYGTVDWEDDFTKWCTVSTISGKESENSGQIMGELMYRILCPYSKRVTAKHRIVIKGRDFSIIGEPINVDLSNQTLEIHAKAITNA